MSYLGVFICVLSAYDVYDVYEEKNTVLITSSIILLSYLDFRIRYFHMSL